MFFDDNRSRQSQSLSRALPYFLGGEKRIKNIGANAFGNSGAGVGDRDDDAIAVLPSTDGDAAFFASIFDYVADGVGGIDEKLKRPGSDRPDDSVTGGSAPSPVSTSATYLTSLRATIKVLSMALFMSAGAFSELRSTCENSFMARTMVATRLMPSSI